MKSLTCEMKTISNEARYTPLEPDVGGEAVRIPGQWLFPGLGCRYVGMGNDILGGQYPEANRLVAEAEAFFGYDLREVCLEGSGRKFVPPEREAQAIYVVECAYAEVLAGRGYRPSLVCGHSLGNWAAAYACGAYDFLTGLELVTHIEGLLRSQVDGRGQAMGVIIGLDEGLVISLCAEEIGVWVANWNSPGQYVIGGLEGGVDRVLATAISRSARQARRLPGERALHTPCMEEVVPSVQKRLEQVNWQTPRIPLLGSHDGIPLCSASDIQRFLGDFMALPVRWEQAVRTMRCQRSEDFVEVGPATVLSKMLPYIDRDAAILTASDLLEQKFNS